MVSTRATPKSNTGTVSATPIKAIRKQVASTNSTRPRCEKCVRQRKGCDRKIPCNNCQKDPSGCVYADSNARNKAAVAPEPADQVDDAESNDDDDDAAHAEPKSRCQKCIRGRRGCNRKTPCNNCQKDPSGCVYPESNARNKTPVASKPAASKAIVIDLTSSPSATAAPEDDTANPSDNDAANTEPKPRCQKCVRGRKGCNRETPCNNRQNDPTNCIPSDPTAAKPNARGRKKRVTFKTPPKPKPKPKDPMMNLSAFEALAAEPVRRNLGPALTGLGAALTRPVAGTAGTRVGIRQLSPGTAQRVMREAILEATLPVGEQRYAAEEAGLRVSYRAFVLHRGFV